MLFGSAAAQADALDELMQSLKSKGVISDADFQRITSAREADKKVPAQAPAASPSAVTGNFKDAIVFSSADGANTTQLTGRVQTDYRNFSNSGDNSTFELRRVYLGAKGKFWNDYKYFMLAGILGVIALVIAIEIVKALRPKN